MGKKSTDLFSLIDNYKNFSQSNNIEGCEKNKMEIDSILSLSGFYKDEQLNTDLLIDCMQKSYDFKNKKNDSTSTYYRLLKHLIFLSENQSIYNELPPSLHLKTINSIISDKLQDSDFYRIISIIFFQSITNKIYDYDEKINKLESNINTKTENNIKNKHEQNSEMQLSSNSPCNEHAFIIVEDMPKFSKGIEALNSYLRINTTGIIQGKVIIQFVVDCNGNIIEPKIIKGLTPLADKLALDLIKSMPTWIPGKQRKKALNVSLIHPVTFE